MLGQTLSFAKPLKLQVQDTGLADLIARCVREVGTLPIMAGMSVEVRSEPGLVAKVDPQLFGEVFTNLLRNAGEACQGKGHVEVTAARDEDWLVIEVADDGPGVPTNLHEEIFKPFRSSKDYGTGIGLAFCRKVVESHGGSIGLVERPGSGACFRIELGPASIA